MYPIKMLLSNCLGSVLIFKLVIVVKIITFAEKMVNMYKVHRNNQFQLEVNLWMRIINGNGVPENLLILYQNIPCTYSPASIKNSIDYILYKFKPDILGIAEPKFIDLSSTWPGYKLIKGNLKGGQKIRLN